MLHCARVYCMQVILLQYAFIYTAVLDPTALPVSASVLNNLSKRLVAHIHSIHPDAVQSVLFPLPLYYCQQMHGLQEPQRSVMVGFGHKI